MSRSDAALLRALQRAMRACHPIALRYFRSPRLRVDRKPDQSPVTAADRAVEERLRAALRRLCPGEVIVGEEFGGEVPEHGSYWTVDPIDGTRAFSRGLPTWAIMVGRVDRGHPALGACDFPALATRLAVAPGVPAHEHSDGARRRLPTPRRLLRLDDAVLLHGGLRWWPADVALRHRFAALAARCYLERSYGDCYGYLWGLRGQVDIVLDYGVKVWDMVPLAALALRTGRVMTDFRGHPSWTGPETVVAGPELARQVCRILGGSGGARVRRSR
jgi:histidinol-phosphatase